MRDLHQLLVIFSITEECLTVLALMFVTVYFVPPTVIMVSTYHKSNYIHNRSTSPTNAILHAYEVCNDRLWNDIKQLDRYPKYAPELTYSRISLFFYFWGSMPPDPRCMAATRLSAYGGGVAPPF